MFERGSKSAQKAAYAEYVRALMSDNISNEVKDAIQNARWLASERIATIKQMKYIQSRGASYSQLRVDLIRLLNDSEYRERNYLSNKDFMKQAELKLAELKKAGCTDEQIKKALEDLYKSKKDGVKQIHLQDSERIKKYIRHSAVYAHNEKVERIRRSEKLRGVMGWLFNDFIEFAEEIIFTSKTYAKSSIKGKLLKLLGNFVRLCGSLIPLTIVGGFTTIILDFLIGVVIDQLVEIVARMIEVERQREKNETKQLTEVIYLCDGDVGETVDEHFQRKAQEMKELDENGDLKDVFEWLAVKFVGFFTQELSFELRSKPGIDINKSELMRYIRENNPQTVFNKTARNDRKLTATGKVMLYYDSFKSYENALKSGKKSTCIESFSYGFESKKLTVIFIDYPMEYIYNGVPYDVYMQMLKSPENSLGEFFNYNIRNYYSFTKQMRGTQDLKPTQENNQKTNQAYNESTDEQIKDDPTENITPGDIDEELEDLINPVDTLPSGDPVYDAEFLIGGGGRDTIAGSEIKGEKTAIKIKSIQKERSAEMSIIKNVEYTFSKDDSEFGKTFSNVESDCTQAALITFGGVCSQIYGAELVEMQISDITTVQFGSN